MCDEGTGDEAMWYGPNVTCARRDSAMVCRSVWPCVSRLYGSGERLRFDEERVPYGLLGDQAELPPLGLAIPLAIPAGVVVVEGKTMLSPREAVVAVVDPSFVAAPVVELDREMPCGWPWP